MSASPAGPQLYLDAGHPGVVATVRGGGGATLVILGDAGAIATASIPADVPADDEWSLPVTVPRGTTYVRAQVVGSTGDVQAVTSPLWWPTHP